MTQSIQQKQPLVVTQIEHALQLLKTKQEATEDGHIKNIAEHIKGENADWVMTMGSRHHQTRIFRILDNISYPIIFQALKIVDCIKRALIPKQLMQFLELKLKICSCLV